MSHHETLSTGTSIHDDGPKGAVWSRAWLGSTAEMYEPKLWRPAGQIKIAQFRQIYLWPLALRFLSSSRDNAQSIAEQLEETRRLLLAEKADDRAVWEEIPDLLDHLDAPLAATADMQ